MFVQDEGTARKFKLKAASHSKVHWNGINLQSNQKNNGINNQKSQRRYGSNTKEYGC
jgi:hypothetical protein